MEILTEFELREGRVAVCGVLDPEWLRGLSVQRLSFARKLAKLGKVFLFLVLIL